MSQKRTHEQMNGTSQKRCLVAGGAGFIGSHLAKRLKEEGHFVRVADWQENIYFKQSDYCSEYVNLDLRWLENCVKACEGMDEVYNLAADMGGMGFIGTNNHATILYNNTMISYNLLEGARRAKTVKRFFYSSSACVYPEHIQLDPNNPGLKESDAWPAHPQDAYGLEKLVSEECAKHYGEDFHIQVRIGRFHNIYGAQGTWKGGREKAPAAFMRKAITSTKDFEVWGDGKQTRSFCYVDDCVEAVLRLMKSDHKEPINIGSEEMVSMNQMADLVMEVANNKLPIRHIAGPEGVRGRNSNNDMVRKVLKWEPSINLRQGLTKLNAWMRQEIEKEKAAGVDVSVYSSSKTIVNRTPEQVGLEKNN